MTDKNRRIRHLVSRKHSVSEMVAYVLLIVIAISISIIVYAYINDMIIKKKITCPEGTNLIIKNYSCSGGILTLTVKNNGLHSVDGFIIHASQDEKKPRFILNEAGKIETGGEIYFTQRLNSSESKTISFNYGELGKVTKVEIKPFRFETNRIMCEDAIITQEIPDCE